MRVLSFDMGIRNLAFCIMDCSGVDFSIVAWDNVDILVGKDSQTASRCKCGGPPSWVDGNDNLWCKRCVKASKAGLTGLPTGVSLTIKSLKELGTKEGWIVKGAKKDDLMTEVKKRYLMPYKKPKDTMKTDLLVILNGINTFISSNLEIFKTVDLIRIENQPVLSAPTMKSVQMILFTLLAHRLKSETGWNGKIAFVHASKKTEEAQDAVDEAGGSYKARKDTAESLVLQKLPEGAWRTFFTGRKKRSDLADAFLMCVRQSPG